MTFNGNQHTSEWTPEHDAILRQQWSEGQTATVIGQAIGRSRSAVLGKLWRLGLRRGRGYKNSLAPPKRIKPPKPVVAKRVSMPIAKAAPAIAEPPGLNKLLWELGETECHWPVNDGNPFRFCALEKAGNGPYCGFHTRVGLKAKEVA